MGNWNSHPDQTVERKPPMQFQDEQVAEEYYPEEAFMNQYAWVYIVGAILILFAVIGCCYCMCSYGEKPAVPAKTQGYSAISTNPPSAQLSSTDQMMYAAFPTKAPSMKAPSMKQPGIYPTF